jgi:hypothetical protein
MKQAAAQYHELIRQQEDFIHTMAAREDARATTPSVGSTAMLTPMMNEQQRALEASMSAASTVPYDRTIGGMTYYDRLTGQSETTCDVTTTPCITP